jgi:hypothetical protein
MMKAHARQLFKALGLTLVAALLVVPPALGDRGAASSSGAYTVHVYRLVETHGSPVPLVTDHSGRNRTQVPTDLGPLDPWAYSLVHRTAATATPATPASVASESIGFVWRDAGVGAGVTIAAMLFVVGAMALRRRRGMAHAHL